MNTYDVEVLAQSDAAIYGDHLPFYRKPAKNKGPSLVFDDLKRGSFGIRDDIRHVFFNVVFLQKLLACTSREDLISTLISNHLPPKFIEQQINELIHLLQIDDDIFNSILQSTNQEERVSLLEQLFHKIFQEEQAVGIFEAYSQGYGHGFAVQTFSDQAVQRFVDGRICPYNTSNNIPGGELCISIDEVTKVPTIYFSSYSTLQYKTYNDEFQHIPGITKHKIVWDSINKKFIVTELLASNYVLFNLCLVPNIKITQELLDLAQAEEDLRNAVLLCMQLKFLPEESIEGYNVGLDDCFSNLNLQTASSEQLVEITSKIYNLYGTFIPKNIREFVEQKARMQLALHEAPVPLPQIFEDQDGVRPFGNEFDESWLRCTPNDVKDLPNIHKFLQTDRTVRVGTREFKYSLFALLMIVESKICSNSVDNPFSPEEREKFALEVTNLKQSDLPIMVKMQHLSALVLEYDDRLLAKKIPGNCQAVILHELINAIQIKSATFSPHKLINTCETKLATSFPQASEVLACSSKKVKTVFIDPCDRYIDPVAEVLHTTKGSLVPVFLDKSSKSVLNWSNLTFFPRALYKLIRDITNFANNEIKIQSLAVIDETSQTQMNALLKSRDILGAKITRRIFNINRRVGTPIFPVVKSHGQLISYVTSILINLLESYNLGKGTSSEGILFHQYMVAYYGEEWRNTLPYAIQLKEILYALNKRGILINLGSKTITHFGTYLLTAVCGLGIVSAGCIMGGISLSSYFVNRYLMRGDLPMPSASNGERYDLPEDAVVVDVPAERVCTNSATATTCTSTTIASQTPVPQPISDLSQTLTQTHRDVSITILGADKSLISASTIVAPTEESHVIAGEETTTVNRSTSTDDEKSKFEDKKLWHSFFL